MLPRVKPNPCQFLFGVRQFTHYSFDQWLSPPKEAYYKYNYCGDEQYVYQSAQGVSSYQAYQPQN